MANKLSSYLNPISHLGDRDYSIKLPFLVPLATATGLEVYANEIIHDPSAVGLFAIILFIPQIIYFAFRFGIPGGVTSTTVTIAYYVYIIFSRTSEPGERIDQWQTIAILGILYLLLAYIIGWLKQTIDSSVDREANEKRRLQAILNQLPTGIIITNEKGKIVQANKKIEEILGKKISSGLIAGKDTHPHGKRNGRQITPSEWPITQVLAGKNPSNKKTFTIEKDDGKKIYLQISATTIENRRGKIIAAASILSDITNQKEMEKRKDDFINMASHELKTPITSLKLYLEALRRSVEKNNKKRTKSVIKSISHQTERLQELASDLLDVSRLQTGKLNFNNEKFRIDSLIVRTVADLKDAVPDHKIIIDKNPASLVFGDQFRLYQVLTNLITNAAKYSPQDTEITVNAKRTRGKIVISVKDKGIGIRKEQQKKIFDRLYQVTDPTEKTFPGLGMGLYISKEIVKRHKGKIWVESERDKGSTFFFSLPLSSR